MNWFKRLLTELKPKPVVVKLAQMLELGDYSQPNIYPPRYRFALNDDLNAELCVGSFRIDKEPRFYSVYISGVALEMTFADRMELDRYFDKRAKERDMKREAYLAAGIAKIEAYQPVDRRNQP
jgi:hypothetical protein